MSNPNAAHAPAAANVVASAAAHEQAGLQFLEQLESKHNQVLDELDALNERIEQVLQRYAASRQTPASHPPQAPTVAGHINEQSYQPQRRAV